MVAKLAAGVIGGARNPTDSGFTIFTIDRKLAALRAAVKMLAGLNEKNWRWFIFRAGWTHRDG